MKYERPKNPNPLNPEQKLAMLREYIEHYQRLAVVDPSSLNQKVPRDVFSELLIKIGALLVEESERAAESSGPVREFLDNNPLPPRLAQRLPDGFRTFCLDLNALKQWIAAEQGATDRYLLGGHARQLCREATDHCLITGDVLGTDAELHHPLRDGRPPILLSKRGHASIERQQTRTAIDAFEHILYAIRRERNGSWALLRRGCLDLLGMPNPSKSKASVANARAFARKVSSETKTSFSEIIAWLDNKGL